MSATIQNGGAPPLSILDRLKGEADELREEAGKLEERRAEIVRRHLEELAQIDHTRMRIRRVLKALGEEEPKPKPQQPRSEGAPYARAGVSRERALEVAGHIQSLLEEDKKKSTLTVLEVAKRMELRPDRATHLYATFAALHQIGFLGRAGVIGNRKQKLFRVLDADVLKQLEVSDAN